MEASMAETTPLLSTEQWLARLHTWAIEQWGQARAEAIRPELEATAQHLVTVGEYPLEMEHVPGFFFTDDA
jgi:hypothetical protein